jgi:hypothetical protein
MSLDSVEKTEQAKRAVGSILNLIRYQPAATLEEAGTRLRLIDEFALEAFLAISDVEDAEFSDTEDSATPWHSGGYLGHVFRERSSNLGMPQ